MDYTILADNSIEVLKPIQKSLDKNLEKLKIKEHEFLVDKTERAPYRLIPDYSIESSKEEEREGSSSIRIFYKINRYAEPIEKRSHVIYTLAVNKTVMMRGFVIPSKYDTVRKFLKDNFDYRMPDREK